jgi:hypothetical protein
MLSLTRARVEEQTQAAESSIKDTCQTLHLVEAMKSTLEAISDGQQKHYSHFQTTMEDVVQSNKNIYKAILRLPTDLPPQVMLQQPVELLDAKGYPLPFHLDFVVSREVRLGMLSVWPRSCY